MIRRIQEIIKARPQILVVWDSVLVGLALVSLVGVFLWARIGEGRTGVEFIDEAFTINFSSEEALPLIGSINGEKYYTKGCSGVNRIKPENRIYFSSVGEAVGAGYSAAAGC